MIEWLRRLSLGMRFKSETVQILEDDIKRFRSRVRSRSRFIWTMKAAQRNNFQGSTAASGWHHAASQCVLRCKLARWFGAPSPHRPLGLMVLRGCFASKDPTTFSISRAKSSL